MANTYTQLYVMLVFGAKGHQNLIRPEIETELFKYICGIAKNLGQFILEINGSTDHIHILCSIKPDKSISDFVRDIKANSSRFINEKKWFVGKFHWQTGYGAFSYSRSQIDNVGKYIQNQKEHHKKNSFREEYAKLLESFKIEYDEKYIFE